MRVTLIHNPDAGARRIPDSVRIVAALAAFGWKARAVPRTDLDTALKNPGDAVLVAGGDGTVGRVAKRLAGTGVPMGVIPTGTANNVARTLGVGVEPSAAIESLPQAVLRDIDLGVVSTRDASAAAERFLEGCGVGLLARVMAEGAKAGPTERELNSALDRIARELENCEAGRASIDADGQDLSGEYLLASVMNLRSLGPALGLAPDAQFDDGLLDVVLVRPEHRAALLSHLRRAAPGSAEPPQLEVHRAEHVSLSGHGRWVHVDDCARELPANVEVCVEPRAVRFLIPGATA